MFQEFPYTDMHQLNLDWIIKIAKDFLDQYTHIQQLISDGETSLQTLTSEGSEQLQTLTSDGLDQLQDKADALEALLNQWYSEHSEDIAGELASALSSLDSALTAAVTAFTQAANERANEAIESIPADYTELASEVYNLHNEVSAALFIQRPTFTRYKYIRKADGEFADTDDADCCATADYIYVFGADKVIVNGAYLVGGRTIWGYSASQTPVSVLVQDKTITESTVSFSVPAGVYYIRITGNYNLDKSYSIVYNTQKIVNFFSMDEQFKKPFFSTYSLRDSDTRLGTNHMYLDDKNQLVNYNLLNVSGFGNSGYDYVVYRKFGGSYVNSGWKDINALFDISSCDDVYMEFRNHDNSTISAAQQAEIETMAANVYAHRNSLPDYNHKIAVAYVDGTNGNNNNDGSEFLPYKTIRKAIFEGYTKISVAPGTYTEQLEIKNTNIEIFAAWPAYDANTPNMPKVVIDGNSTITTVLRMDNCPNVTLEGIIIKNCTGNGCRMFNCDNLVIQNCDFDLNGESGIELNNCNGVLRGCTAKQNGRDGFNMNYYGHTEFYNCSGINNGDDGISHHQGTTGMIFGGEWYGNAKGGIASPAAGSSVEIYNVYSHNNKYGIYSIAWEGTEARTYKVWNSVLSNNNEYGIITRRNNVILYGCKVSGNTLGQFDTNDTATITILD